MFSALSRLKFVLWRAVIRAETFLIYLYNKYKNILTSVGKGGKIGVTNIFLLIIFKEGYRTMTKKIIIVLLAVILTLGLVACQDKDSHTLTFVGQDGAEVEKMEVSDEKISLPAAPEIEGYQFAGWYLHSANSGLKLDSEYFVRNEAKSDVTAYARYKKIYHNLTFYSDEYKVAIRQVADEQIELPEAPPKDHYNFIGWYLDSVDSGIELTPNYFVGKPATGEVSAYAKYERIQYTLTFAETGETILISDKEIELPEIAKLAGYNVVGWCVDGSNVIISNDYFVKHPATGDITVSALYTDEIFIAQPTGRDTCTITGFIGEDLNVNIPDTITLKIGDSEKDYKVTSIDAGAFADKAIESVFIPASVTYIAPGAFRNCSALKSIEIDEANEAYTSNNGANCIVEVKVSENTAEDGQVTYTTTKTLILGCKNTVISDDINAIADYAFAGCVGLEEIVIPASVKSVGAKAFDGCTALVKVVINVNPDDENGQITVAPDAFNGVKIEDITAPVWVINNISKDNLVNVTVNAGQEIGNGMFKDAKKLVSVTFDCKLDKIAEDAFDGCSKLTAIHIPASVTYVAEGAFTGCIALESITVDAENKDYKAVNNCLLLVEKDGLRVIQGCKNSELTDEVVVSVNENGEETKLPITSISADAFAGCVDLKEIYIPKSVTELAEGSFAGCTSLTKVVIANTDLKPVANVFEGCKVIKNIEVPMAWVANFVESSKATLETVSITSGDRIADSAFYGCKSLVKVTLADSITEIGASAFAGCTKLTTIELSSESKLATVGRSAFDGCSAFCAIAVGSDEPAFVVPATVISIGDYAFRGTAVTGLSFAAGSKIADIGYKAFANCNKLESVSIPNNDGLTVDFDAFNGCQKITSATVPADFIRSLSNANSSVIVTLEITNGKVDCYYIREMTNLKTLIIGAGVTDIVNVAFEGCSKLEEIVVAAENVKYRSEGNCLIKKADTEDGTETIVLGCTVSEIPTEGKFIIGTYAFAQSEIAEIEIPANVVKVETYAFSSCRKLATVVIKSDKTEVAVNAFDGCDKITKAVIPATAIEAIPTVALVEVEITSGNVTKDAFNGCLTLKTVTIATGVTVENDAFKGCINVTKLEATAGVITTLLNGIIPEKLVDVTVLGGTIGVDTFKGCAALKVLTILDCDGIAAGALDELTITTATVPAWAISYLPATVTKLTVEAGDLTAEGSSISGFDALTTVVIGKDVDKINSASISDEVKATIKTLTVDAENALYESKDNVVYLKENGEEVLSLVVKAPEEENPDADTPNGEDPGDEIPGGENTGDENTGSDLTEGEDPEGVENVDQDSGDNLPDSGSENA